MKLNKALVTSLTALALGPLAATLGMELLLHK